MEIRLHKLENLTQITPSKVTFKWTKIEQDAFDVIKRTLAWDTLLTFPDFNGEFEIHTNTSDL